MFYEHIVRKILGILVSSTCHYKLQTEITEMVGLKINEQFDEK